MPRRRGRRWRRMGGLSIRTTAPEAATYSATLADSSDRAHNPKVVGSNPTPATTEALVRMHFRPGLSRVWVLPSGGVKPVSNLPTRTRPDPFARVQRLEAASDRSNSL